MLHTPTHGFGQNVGTPLCFPPPWTISSIRCPTVSKELRGKGKDGNGAELTLPGYLETLCYSSLKRPGDCG